MSSSGAVRALATLLLAGGLVAGPPAAARVYASKAQALREAFPDAERIDARSVVLNEEQVREIEARARAPVDTKLVTLHTAYRGERVLGHAIIDVHVVRTLHEAFLVVIAPNGSVRSVRMLAFHEPEEYLPSARWLRQFEGRSLSDDLRLRRGIHGIAGSTLTARAVSAGVRRALALYAVLIEQEK